MTSPLHPLATRLLRSIRHFTLVLGPLLAASSCQTLTGFVVGEAAEALTGQEVDVRDRGESEGYDVLVNGERVHPPEDAAAWTYVHGPVEAWERGLRPTASTSGSPYFLGRFSRDGCLTFDATKHGATLTRSGSMDPFGPLERPEDEKGLPDHNTLDIEDDYVRLGEVPLGGAAPETRLWGSLRIFGMAGGPCAFVGIPVLSVGPRTDDPVISR